MSDQIASLFDYKPLSTDNADPIGFEWEIYISDEEGDGPDQVSPPDSPRSASSIPLEAPSNALQALQASQTSSSGGNHSIRSGIQAITLLEIGMLVEQITALTFIKKSRIYILRKEALCRGYNPSISKIVEVYHVEDAKRSGRPKTFQVVIDLIIATVTKNSTTREYSCAQIASKVSATPSISSVSASTVWRTLKAERYSMYKRTVKLGLNADQKKKRLQ